LEPHNNLQDSILLHLSKIGCLRALDHKKAQELLNLKPVAEGICQQLIKLIGSMQENIQWINKMDNMLILRKNLNLAVIHF
jgi:hypothetical protein